MTRAGSSALGGSSAIGGAVLAYLLPDVFGQGMFASFALLGAFLLFRAGWRAFRAGP